MKFEEQKEGLIEQMPLFHPIHVPSQCNEGKERKKRQVKKEGRIVDFPRFRWMSSEINLTMRATHQLRVKTTCP